MQFRLRGLTATGYPVWAVVAARQNAQHFPVFFRVYAGYNRGKAAC